MIKKVSLIYFLMLLLSLLPILSIYSQNIIVYNSSNSGLPEDDVTCITPDKYGAKWIGTSDSGIVKFYNNQWSRYDSANSGMPGNKIRDIVFDRNGIMWVIISGKGLGRYDGQNWILYNQNNSPLNGVSCLAVDSNDTKWMVTAGRLAKFDNTNWTLFDTANGGFYSGSLGMDFEGDTLWIAAGLKGLARYCNGSLNYYNMQNSGMPDNVARCIYIDKSRNKWVGTMFGGAAKFNSAQNIWTNFDLMDSLNLGNNLVPDIISDDSSTYFNTSFGLYRYSRNGFQLINNGGVNCLNYDKYFNLWIGNTNEVVIYNPYGIVNVKNDEEIILKRFTLHQNYPNPFNPSTKIRFSVVNGFPIKTFGNDPPRRVVLKVYDVMGREVQTLVNESLKSGTYEATFDGSSLHSGVYFYKLITDGFSETKKMIMMK
ncbi:MAG: T9SS type A sorting domain-containing protein [Ignavibacteria bacterium]